MKLVAPWLAVLGFAIVTAGGCTVSHRTSDFTCEKPADCSTGRTCSDGLCVASQVDSGVATDAQSNACPPQCTSCNASAKSCTIDCALSGSCKQQVTCPTGWNCNIACSADGACSSGIDCTSSKSCTITCGGRQSCQGVTCGAGPCKVDCAGSGSCRDVNCGLSCACDVACGNSLCLGLTCKTPQCISPTPLNGCTSLLPSCNTCL